MEHKKTKSKANETRNFVAVDAWNRKGGYHDDQIIDHKRDRKRAKLEYKDYDRDLEDRGWK